MTLQLAYDLEVWFDLQHINLIVFVADSEHVARPVEIKARDGSIPDPCLTEFRLQIRAP